MWGGWPHLERQTSASTRVVICSMQAQRDLVLREYFDRQLARVAELPPGDKPLALARELCALKLSESQLQASLAAARHVGDAAAALAASLNTALKSAETRLDQLQMSQLTGGEWLGSHEMGTPIDLDI